MIWDEITVLMPIQDPDTDLLQRSISSIENQSVEVDEFLIVETSLDKTGIRTNLNKRHIHKPEWNEGNTLTKQRRLGVREAEGELILTTDDDFIFKRKDHIERQLELMEKHNAVAVGGIFKPINNNLEGKMVSSAIKNLTGVNYLAAPLWKKGICPQGSKCFPEGTNSGDITRTLRILESGNVVRDDELIVLTQLPTHRQKKIRNIGMSSVAGLATLKWLGAI